MEVWGTALDLATALDEGLVHGLGKPAELLEELLLLGGQALGHLQKM